MFLNLNELSTKSLFAHNVTETKLAYYQDIAHEYSKTTRQVRLNWLTKGGI